MRGERTMSKKIEKKVGQPTPKIEIYVTSADLIAALKRPSDKKLNAQIKAALFPRDDVK